MAVYSFDGVNKRITLPVGMTVLDLIDLYSRYKEWIRAGNAGYDIAYTTVGGDIPDIPLYLFQENGWDIVPWSANHTLTVINGILKRRGGGDPFVDPLGSYKIRIYMQSPGIAIGYTSNGSQVDPTVIADIADKVNQILLAGGSLTPEQELKLQELWQMRGLDVAKPVTHTDTTISSDGINLLVDSNTTRTIISRV